MKKFILAWTAFVIVGFIITALWHLVLFGSVYESLNIYTRKPIFALGITSFILEGLAFVYIFRFFRTGKSPAKEGALFGILAFGVLMGSVGALAEAAKFSATSLFTYLLVEGFFYLITGTILGTIVGLIYGKSHS
jgi:hypothetical protein